MTSGTYHPYQPLQTASTTHLCHSHLLAAQVSAAAFAAARSEVCRGSSGVAVRDRSWQEVVSLCLCGWVVIHSASRSGRCMRLEVDASRSLLGARRRSALLGDRNAASWGGGVGVCCSLALLRRFEVAVSPGTSSGQPEPMSMVRALQAND